MLFETLKPNGAFDSRSAEEKAKDFEQAEIVASASAVPWEEKKTTRTYPVLNQKSTNSCVAHTLAKMMGMYFQDVEGEYIDLSRTHIYQRRSNKPGEGMIGADAFKIAQSGVTLHALAPNKPNDKEMDAFQIAQYKKDIGELFGIGNYITIREGDFEQVASTIYKTGKGIMVWFYAERDEWSREVPEIKNPNLKLGNAYVRHSVTAVDFTVYKGKKCIVIEDSAHFGGINRRYITEEFFKARNFYSAYFMNFKFESTLEKPRYTGTTTSVQDCMKHYGTFPKNTDSTGFWGNITQRSVEDFCKNEGVTPVPNRKMNAALDAKLKQKYP